MIIQGSNLPIIINFRPEDLLVENITDLSAKLSTQEGYSIKSWEFSDVSFYENRILFPLLQTETVSIKKKVVLFELKYLTKDINAVFHTKVFKIAVKSRFDRATIGDNTAYSGQELMDEIVADIVTGKYIVEIAEGAESFYTNLKPTTKDLGGIKAGSTFNNVPLPEMWDKLLYSTEYPELTNPSSTITLNSDKYVEVGIPTDIRITTRFDRGKINPSYGTNGFRSGLPEQYIYNEIIGIVTSSELVDNQTIVGYVFNTPTSLTITSRVSYLEGEQPLDSDGMPYSSPLVAGNTSDSSVKVIGVYPIFATTENIEVATRQTLTDSKTLSYHFAPETPLLKQSFQWDESFGTLKGVKQYNVLSKEFEWLGNSEEASVAMFDVEDVVVTLASGDRNYKKYTNNRVQVGGRELQIFIG